MFVILIHVIRTGFSHGDFKVECVPITDLLSRHHAVISARSFQSTPVSRAVYRVQTRSRIEAAIETPSHPSGLPDLGRQCGPPSRLNRTPAGSRQATETPASLDPDGFGRVHAARIRTG